MTDPTILSFFGLMRKAGALAIGAEDAFDAARERKLPLLALASDAGPNTASAMANAGDLAQAPLIRLPFTKGELGSALGVGECAALAVLDTGFALALCKKLFLEQETAALTARLEREKKRKAKKLQKKAPARTWDGKTGAAARLAAKRVRTGRTQAAAPTHGQSRGRVSRRHADGKRGK